MSMNEHIIQSGNANFDEDVLKSSLPVLVDYWADRKSTRLNSSH